MTEGGGPLVRQAARVILVDEQDRVLLVHGRDPARPDRPTWWITAGGGQDEGESAEDAARREVREETGIVLDELGPVVLRRSVEFDFEGVHVRQHEVFFLVRVGTGDVRLDTSGWNDIERRALLELRWWRGQDLAVTDDVVYPEGLLELLRENGIG
ncbi:MAG: NUDIX hydrolase [Actinomycetales bacterium]